jgi:hypothetical protein
MVNDALLGSQGRLCNCFPQVNNHCKFEDEGLLYNVANAYFRRGTCKFTNSSEGEKTGSTGSYIWSPISISSRSRWGRGHEIQERILYDGEWDYNCEKDCGGMILVLKTVAQPNIMLFIGRNLLGHSFKCKVSE